jgi:3-methyladenine DNA glycosylase AlkC
MTTPSLHDRKPALRLADISDEVRAALSNGLIATKNLTEWLAVDRRQLWYQVKKELGLPDPEHVDWSPQAWGELSALKQSFLIGKWIASLSKVGDPTWAYLSNHVSDVSREWTAIAVGYYPQLSFSKRLAWIKQFANDDNAGLREIAWLALRRNVQEDVPTAIRALVPWTGSRSDRLRRYASEITRPCGVWTCHIAELKQQPQMALPILNELNADESKYVQNSVGNWLNDASKSQPDWVREVVQDWVARSDHAATRYIAKRALRTLSKKT